MAFSAIRAHAQFSPQGFDSLLNTVDKPDEATHSMISTLQNGDTGILYPNGPSPAECPHRSSDPSDGLRGRWLIGIVSEIAFVPSAIEMRANSAEKGSAAATSSRVSSSTTLNRAGVKETSACCRWRRPFAVMDTSLRRPSSGSFLILTRPLDSSL